MDTTPICMTCKHYIPRTELRVSPFKCHAYLEGIPVEIIKGEVDHTKPYEGDIGIQYEPIPGIETEESEDTQKCDCGMADTVKKIEVDNETREKLSELEHEQWVAWSKDIAATENITPERLGRWKKLWRPYSELTEEEKDKDREWADKVTELVKAETDELDEYQDLLSKSYIGNILQAIKAGALYGSYQDVSDASVSIIHDVITSAFMRKRLSLKEMIDKIVKQTPVDPDKARLIVRTETHNISQLARKIDWQQMEKERGELFNYVWSVKHDHRTSPQCLEIEKIVGSGRPLEEVEKIIQDVARKYIPNWKAEMTPHPNCRSTLIRKV